METYGVPKTMIRATRYGSGSTRLKPSSCDSTAGSPSMTADPWYRCVQELAFKESRALSQTATLKIHSTELALSTPPWIVENLPRRPHKRSCKQARFKHKTEYPATRSQKGYHRIRDRVDLTPNVVIVVFLHAHRDW